MTLFASARMAGQLNAMINSARSVDQVAVEVVGSDVAHHVVDPDGVLGLDPTRAAPLADALDSLADGERQQWVLVLPTPGRLGALRGPTELNQLAVAAGAAVVGATCGLAVIPFAVGQAVQWRVAAAERPGLPPTPYEAERQLNETVLSAGAALARLQVAGGRRPTEPETVVLGAGPAPRRQAAAVRAARLWVACSRALTDDGGSISSFEADARARQLRAVRDAAADALCAAATFAYT